MKGSSFPTKTALGGKNANSFTLKTRSYSLNWKNFRIVPIWSHKLLKGKE
jgi:hypothetical protein